MGRKYPSDGKLSSISRFIASVAHEINNPLTVISVIPELCKSEDNEQCEICQFNQRALEKIEEAEYCGRLIQELVDFSAIILNKEDMDLTSWCR